jgi:hypothetical protein
MGASGVAWKSEAQEEIYTLRGIASFEQKTKQNKKLQP